MCGRWSKDGEEAGGGDKQWKGSGSGKDGEWGREDS